MAEKKIAIITGASSGFGKEFVKLLLDEPEISEIWAIARSGDKLWQLSQEFGPKIVAIPADLSDKESYDTLRKRLETTHVSVQYLVNNAGYAKLCAYDDLSVDESLNMIDLNIGAVVALGLICIPYMPSGSHILNIASQASFFPLPYQNLYSSTKTFVRNYTRALNVELKERGSCATAVCPGWMKTALFDRCLIGAKKAATNFFGIVEPDVVARKALKDAKKGKDISVYGLYVKLTHLLSKLLPQRVMMKLWLRQQKL